MTICPHGVPSYVSPPCEICMETPPGQKRPSELPSRPTHNLVCADCGRIITSFVCPTCSPGQKRRTKSVEPIEETEAAWEEIEQLLDNCTCNPYPAYDVDERVDPNCPVHGKEL